MGKMRNFDILAVAPDQKKPIMVYDAYLGFYTVGLVTEEQVRKMAMEACYTGVLKWTSSWPGALKADAEAVKTEAEVKNKGASFVSMVAKAVAKASTIFCCCGFTAAADDDDDDNDDVWASLFGTHVMIPMTNAVAKE